MLNLTKFSVNKAEGCPAATQDIEKNLENRQDAIDKAAYGPLNPNEPNTDFWEKKAEKWDVSIEEAKKSLCGNCAVFIQTPKMMNCIREGLAAGDSMENAWDTSRAGQLGYCESFDFKCASKRTCDAWVVGGPVR